jgi:hypothetical protein
MAKRTRASGRAGRTGKRKKLTIEQEPLKDLGPRGGKAVKGGTGYVALSRIVSSLPPAGSSVGASAAYSFPIKSYRAVPPSPCN